MEHRENNGDQDQLVVDAMHTQLAYFQNSDPPCRALELPEGILLRYNLAQSLYFYLRTAVTDGKLATRVFATDSPYERTKTLIGEIRTPMFENQADRVHLGKLEEMLRNWVDFVRDVPDQGQDFTSFHVDERPSY